MVTYTAYAAIAVALLSMWINWLTLRSMARTQRRKGY